MNHEEYAQAIRAKNDRSEERVRAEPVPIGQKFAPGTRVRIADNLGPSMSHFPKGRFATVVSTYAHQYGGDDVKSYTLNIDGLGQHSWYEEHQLTLAEDFIRSEVAAMGWPDTI